MTKEKIEELEKQLKKMEGIDSLGSINFNDLFIHPGLKILTKVKVSRLWEKACPYTHLKLYDASMA